jgi:hypothetical protein
MTKLYTAFRLAGSSAFSNAAGSILIDDQSHSGAGANKQPQQRAAPSKLKPQLQALTDSLRRSGALLEKRQQVPFGVPASDLN